MQERGNKKDVLGLSLAGLQGLISVVFMVMLFILDMLPNRISRNHCCDIIASFGNYIGNPASKERKTYRRKGL